MALWFRRPEPVAGPQPATSPDAVRLPLLPFRAWTESLYVTGAVAGDDRLSDLLNRRQPIRVERPSVTPIGAPRIAIHAPSELVLDPFDFDLVLAGTLDRMRLIARMSKRIHKVRHRVRIEGRNFEVEGWLHLFPGVAPEYAVHHPGALFLAVTGGTARRERRLISDPTTDVILVNRYAIRGIRQLDEPLH